MIILIVKNCFLLSFSCVGKDLIKDNKYVRNITKNAYKDDSLNITRFHSNLL